MLPLIVLDAEFVNEVPMIISDEPVVKRIFRPGILLNVHKKNSMSLFRYPLII